jgi:gluconolactonase
MTHTTLRPEFEQLIDPYAPVAQVGTGFTFTEGPIWRHGENFLLFSDMPADVRRRWDPQQGVSEVKRPSNKCNGMTYDADLNLIVCEHATSSLIRERPDGRREIIASHFDGKELNSPNDVCVRSDGSIYFTDPWYGRMPVYGVERPRPLGFQGVYRVPPGGGAPQLLVDRYLFDQPNGICFSPDERRLYVNDTEQTLIRAFDAAPDGTLSNGRIFASGIRSTLEPGVPDGMKCDERGNVWVTAPGGVWVYAPNGDLLGKVRVPELAANLAWGGPDFHTLFLTATHSVYSIPTKLGPRREPYMAAAAGSSAPSPAPHAPASASAPPLARDLTLDPRRCALIIQDLQNDGISEGGAFAASGSPAHARSQNVVENVRRLAQAARARGVIVIHVWFIVEPGALGFTLNAPLFEGVADNKALVRGSWGAAPVSGLEPQSGDFIVEKMRMSAWEGTRLETILKGAARDMIIVTGAWTNMSIEHTARTGADKGYFMIVPEDCCSTMNAEWHNASINYALQNVSVVTNGDAVMRALG